MSAFRSLGISASAMGAHRLWMDVIAENLANAETTRTGEGGPFRRKLAIFMQDGPGVAVRSIVQDPAPPRMIYEPSHPDANPSGYVLFPNVNPIHEMVDMLSATRAYEANVAAFNATKAMLTRALELGRV